MLYSLVVFFNQMTASEMRISDWSSDVCSSDLRTSGGDSSKPPNDISRSTVSRTRVGVKRPSRVHYKSSSGSKEAFYRFVERPPGWCTTSARQRSGGHDWQADQRTVA